MQRSVRSFGAHRPLCIGAEKMQYQPLMGIYVALVCDVDDVDDVTCTEGAKKMLQNPKPSVT